MDFNLLVDFKSFLPRERTFGTPSGNIFFPFREDPFSEDSENNFNRVASPESVSMPLKCPYIAFGPFLPILPHIAFCKALDQNFYQENNIDNFFVDP